MLIDRVVENVSRLVAAPSVSIDSNRGAAMVAADLLESAGFQVEVQEFADPFGVPKFNVAGRRGAGVGGLAYFGHTDVVPVSSWSFAGSGPFEPAVREGRLYGRGSCDMKGSVGCFIAAASQVDAASLRAPVYVFCTADEEVGFHGARHLVRHSPLYREAVAGRAEGLIGEPTELEVVHGHKGIYGMRIVSRGRAAHSSTRGGLNANLAMIPVLAEARRIHDETQTDPRWLHPEFDPPWISWNIGINDHTPAVNITPPQSVCTIYFRPMPGQPPGELIERMQRVAASEGVELTLECQGDPVYTDPAAPFIRRLLALAGRSASKTVAYGTDGVAFTEMHSLAVFGPGSIQQAHTDDEWIALEQLERGAAIYENLIRSVC
ncbi:M20 family metallopeptidase [Planctellipticum variicoloris]|uniref:M20 family metallopeptidase n=1 Tax=Planctellipticum variicoloris TaxID=3064265 RepID=UPI002BF16548|nr:M20 family metallopeptidase [Planctomycetaceae bacterium SH412]HTN02433.1 M20 family metallopeptidase [Planctomycetaceae bacterium]